jgi:hypothetical protein
MKADSRRLRVKGTSINPSSPFAEREMSLSRIDSMLFNEEISKNDARLLIIQLVEDGEIPAASVAPLLMALAD